MKTSKNKNKNNHIITPKNLENIIKLFIKSNESRKKKYKRKNRNNINKLVHQQHKNEPQGNILTNYLINQKKENEYKKESGLYNDELKKKADDMLMIKYFETNLSDIKKAIEDSKKIDSTKLITAAPPEEKKEEPSSYLQ